MLVAQATAGTLPTVVVDFILRAAEGVPLPAVKQGASFDLGVRVNTAGKFLGSFTFVVLFDRSVLRLDGRASVGEAGSAVALVPQPGKPPCSAEAVDEVGGVRIVARAATGFQTPLNHVFPGLYNHSAHSVEKSACTRRRGPVGS